MPFLGALISHTNNVSSTINLTYALSKTMKNIEKTIKTEEEEDF